MKTLALIFTPHMEYSWSYLFSPHPSLYKKKMEKEIKKINGFWVVAHSESMKSKEVWKVEATKCFNNMQVKSPHNPSLDIYVYGIDSTICAINH